MTRAQDAAQVGDDPRPQLFSLGFLACLPQGDSQVGLADQGVGMILAEGFAQA